MPSCARFSLYVQFSTLTLRSATIDNVTAILFVTSGFCRELAENCALPGYYAASSGNLLQKFSGHPISHIFRVTRNLKLILNPRRWEGQVVPERL